MSTKPREVVWKSWVFSGSRVDFFERKKPTKAAAGRKLKLRESRGGHQRALCALASTVRSSSSSSSSPSAHPPWLLSVPKTCPREKPPGRVSLQPFPSHDQRLAASQLRKQGTRQSTDQVQRLGPGPKLCFLNRPFQPRIYHAAGEGFGPATTPGGEWKPYRSVQAWLSGGELRSLFLGKAKLWQCMTSVPTLKLLTCPIR